MVAAFYPLAWAAERVGGDTVDVRNLTPPGTEPHDLELSARDVERDPLGRRRPLSRPGLPAGGRGRRRGRGRRGDRPSRRAAASCRRGARGGRGRRRHEAESDPHVWLDPVRMRGDRRPDRRRARPSGRGCELADRELRALDREFRARPRTTATRREVVTSHAAFGYLARALRARAGRDHGRLPRGRAHAARPRGGRRARARDEGDDDLLRDARLAAARRDRRPRDRRRHRRPRSDRGPHARTTSTAAPTTFR